MANVAFVRTSVNWQGWLGKMSQLLPMASTQKDERARAMIDEMMADIFVSKTVIKDVIGVSKHLGDAVTRILDLVQGKCKPTKFAAEELVTLLNTLFAANLLPRSKAVLFERIERDLASPVRLTNSEDPAVDKAFFDELLARAISDHGVLGGGNMAMGLTYRWARIANMGGAAGVKKAMEGVRDKLSSGKQKFLFLLAMFDPDADAESRGAIESQIRNLAGPLAPCRRSLPKRVPKRRACRRPPPSRNWCSNPNQSRAARSHRQSLR